jgi:hypothetical protein
MPRLPLGIRSSAYIYPVISGGTLTSDATYYYRTFTANGTLAVENHSVPIDYFVIAGGGQGGFGQEFYDGFEYWYTLSGGGGASGTKAFSSAIFAVNNYSVVIGGAGSGSSIGSIVSVTAGGTGGGGAGNGGSNAEFSGAVASYPSGGGGAGANGNGSGIDGGSAFSAFGSNYGLGGFSQTGFITFNFPSGATNPGYSAPPNSGSGGGGGRGNVSGGIGGSGRVIVRYLRSVVGG